MAAEFFRRRTDHLADKIRKLLARRGQAERLDVARQLEVERWVVCCRCLAHRLGGSVQFATVTHDQDTIQARDEEIVVKLPCLLWALLSDMVGESAQ